MNDTKKTIPAKPVDTGGVEGGGDLWATGFGVVETALNWFTMNYRTTDEEDAAIAKARQILSTEKPTDSMGGETDKENGASPEARQSEGDSVASAADDLQVRGEKGDPIRWVPVAGELYDKQKDWSGPVSIKFGEFGLYVKHLRSAEV